MASVRPRHGSRGTTYRVMWRTPDGRQRSRSLRDAAEARRLVAEMTLAEREGRAPDPNSGAISLARWAEQVLATKPLKPKTRATYEDLLTARILPTFGACEIGSIQRNAIREWVAATAAEVSPRRTQNAFSLLRHLLEEAVVEELIPRNPAQRMRLPQSTSPEVKPWTVEELNAVADAAGRYRTLILWLGLMGTRWAETIGLRHSDIADNVATISSTLSEVRGRFYRVPTKTYATRRLPIPVALTCNPGRQSDDLVFTSPRGLPLRSAQFRDRHFRPACSRASVRPIRIHHLRHTAASLLSQQGLPPSTIQRWLGHQDIRVTMNTYTHTYSSDAFAVAAQLDALLPAPNRN